MGNRSIGVSIGPALIAGLFLIVTTGCPSDPYDPQTWIEKLDDPAEVDRAVTELEHLADPKAIKPLAKVWRKHNKWPRVLRVIVGLADQGTDKGGPFWEDAVPVLVEAVEEFDISDSRSIDDAVFAADALGRARSPDTVQVLVTAATQKIPKLSPGQRVRIAALRALGKFGTNERAVSTLVKILEADTKNQPLQLHAAAANALAETRSPKAVEPLLMALYAISPIYQQVRAALTRVGAPVVPKLIEIFQGRHPALNAYAKAQGFATNCDRAIGPGTDCKAPGNLQFKAAGLLGDLRARDAVPIMVKVLGKPPLVAFFDPKSGAPGPPNHNAILNALRMIGDPSAAAAVRDYMTNPSTDDLTRPIAIDVYSFLARDTRGMDYLEKEMKNDAQESEQIRKACGLAYSRLVTKKSQLAPLQYMIDRYRGKVKEWENKARKATKEDDKTYAERTADGYRELVTEFHQYKTRALVGTKCGSDPVCYAGILELKSDNIVQMLDLPNPDKIDKRDKVNYRVAAHERALFELMKLGPKSRPVLDKLLDKAGSTERFVREGVLLALVQVAEKPCKKCEERLAEVIQNQKDQTTLDYLTADTRIVLNYFYSLSGGGAPR